MAGNLFQKNGRKFSTGLKELFSRNKDMEKWEDRNL